jgi:hypothetical protein
MSFLNMICLTVAVACDVVFFLWNLVDVMFLLFTVDVLVNIVFVLLVVYVLWFVLILTAGVFLDPADAKWIV